MMLGSGAIYGKMLLVRILENNKIDDYLGQIMLALSHRVRKGNRIGPSRGRNRKKHNPPEKNHFQ